MPDSSEYLRWFYRLPLRYREWALYLRKRKCDTTEIRRMVEQQMKVDARRAATKEMVN